MRTLAILLFAIFACNPSTTAPTDAPANSTTTASEPATPASAALTRHTKALGVCDPEVADACEAG